MSGFICASCAYWSPVQETGASFGDCCAHPPVIVPELIGMVGYSNVKELTRFPQTTHNTSCGEHSLRQDWVSPC